MRTVAQKSSSASRPKAPKRGRPALAVVPPVPQHDPDRWTAVDSRHVDRLFELLHLQRETLEYLGANFEEMNEGRIDNTSANVLITIATMLRTFRDVQGALDGLKRGKAARA